MIISLFKISILPFFVSISSEILSSFNTRDKDCALTFKSIAICFCEIVSKFFSFSKRCMNKITASKETVSSFVENDITETIESKIKLLIINNL